MCPTVRVLAVAAIAIAVLTGSSQNVQAKRFAVTECLGVITEPGIYVLQNDISALDSAYCLDVQTSDVTIRLNGFAIAAERAITVGAGNFLSGFKLLGPGRLEGTGLTLVQIFGAKIRGKDVQVKKVTFNNGSLSIAAIGARIEGNEFLGIGALLGIFESEDFGGGCEDNRVVRNKVKLIQADGCRRTLIKNNVIDGENLEDSGMILSGLFDSVSVVQNRISNVPGPGIDLRGNGEISSQSAVIEKNEIRDCRIGINIGPGDEINPIERTLVRMNRLENNQDQIKVIDVFVIDTVFEKNLCDPPDSDPVCTSTFAPVSLAAPTAPTSTTLEAPTFGQAPMMEIPLKSGKLK